MLTRRHPAFSAIVNQRGQAVEDRAHRGHVDVERDAVRLQHLYGFSRITPGPGAAEAVLDLWVERVEADRHPGQLPGEDSALLDELPEALMPVRNNPDLQPPVMSQANHIGERPVQ